MSSRAAVVGGSVVAFASGFTPQEQDDIMNSVRFAQLRAQEKVNPSTFPIEWFYAFVDALYSMGWALDDELQPVSNSSENKRSSLEEETLRELSRVNSPGLISVVKRSVSALKLNAFADSILGKYAASGKLSHFQFVPCERRGDKGSYLYVFMLHLVSESSARPTFFGARRGAQKLRVTTSRMGLYLQHAEYAQHRVGIAEHLIDLGGDYITDLPI